MDSLINQTLKELEFICVNDGATDNSLEILKEYAQKDNRFVIISQENQGPGVARNKGIEVAKGETIMFVDPDDFLELNTCEILYDKYKENNVDIVQFDYQKYRKDLGKRNTIRSLKKYYKKDLGFKLRNGQIYSYKDFKTMDFRYVMLSVCTKLYSTEFIRNNNIRCAPNKHGEDHIFTLKSLLSAKRILYIQKPFYYYRERPESSTNKASKDNFCAIENIKLFKNFLLEQNLFDKYSNEFSQYETSVLAWHYTCIPANDTDEYLQKCKEVLKTNYGEFLRKVHGEPSFIQKIFSVQNTKISGNKVKIIRFLGAEFCLK